MSIVSLKSFIVVVLASVVASDEFPYPKDAPSEINQCRNVIFNCDCGNPGYKFQAVVKQCHFWMPPEQACVRFQHCLECEDGEDRCSACHPGTFGRWCNGACNCKNGGTCNKKDGTCLCPAGYEGDSCQTRKVLMTGELNCHTTAISLMKKEVNIRINVTCPSGCQEAKGDIWGTSIYTEDSSVCRAAIHAGILTNEGGIVFLVENGMYSSFIGTTTVIISDRSTREKRSFRFEIFKSQVNKPIADERNCPENWLSSNNLCVLPASLQDAWSIFKRCQG